MLLRGKELKAAMRQGSNWSVSGPGTNEVVLETARGTDVSRVVPETLRVESVSNSTGPSRAISILSIGRAEANGFPKLLA